MPTIKFSHRYNKFVDSAFGKKEIPDCALLLDIFIKDVKDLSEHFIDYDTCFVNKNNEMENYKLPKKGKVIILLLINGIVWTTIRRYTPQKLKYYKKMRGEWFDIEISEEVTKLHGAV